MTTLYDVCIDMLSPVRAYVGERLVVRPGHPTRPVVVVALDPKGDWQPTRLGPPAYAEIAQLACDGVLELRGVRAPTAPPTLYDVTGDLIAPVLAHAGTILAVQWGHTSRPLVVMEKDGTGEWWPVRVGPPDYGGVVLLARAGVLKLRAGSVPLPLGVQRALVRSRAPHAAVITAE